MEVFPAEGGLAVAGLALVRLESPAPSAPGSSRRADVPELFDVQMQQLARVRSLVAHDRRPRDGRRQAAESQTPEHIPHRREREAERVGDGGAGPPRSAQLEDPALQGGTEAAGRVVRAGRAIDQATAALGPIPPQPNRQHPTFDEVMAFTYEQMMDLVGGDVADSRPRCATLALGTLKAAVKTAEINRKLKSAGKSELEIAELRRAIAVAAEGTGLVLGEGAQAVARDRFDS